MQPLKTICLAAGFLGAASAAALAADLPNRRVAPPIFVAPAFSWTGFYVGLNAGAGFADRNRDTDSILLPLNTVVGSLGTNGTLTTGGRNNSNDAFFVGGGQIGYNYQMTPGNGFVFGAEADIQYVNMRGDRGGVFAPGSYTFVPATPLSSGLAFAPPAATVLTNGNGSGMDYLGTVRARVGYAFDNVLVYATGGLAYAGGGNNGNGGGNSDGKVGYAVGGGVEYGFTPNWSVKVEGLYVSIDRGNNNRGGTGAIFNSATNTVTITNVSRNNNQDIGLFRAGLNYRF